MPFGKQFFSVGSPAGLALGDTVRTAANSTATISFPDGSMSRLGPDTTVMLDSAWLTPAGDLTKVRLVQTAGRTFQTVPSASSSRFRIDTKNLVPGAEGKDFEAEVDLSGNLMLKALREPLAVRSGLLARGQSKTYGANERPKNSAPASDSNDLFLQARRAEEVTAATHAPLGSQQTFIHPGPLTPGSTFSAGSYYTAGGDLTTALSYGGGAMRIAITAPDGRSYPAEGASPLTVRIVNGIAGEYKANVSATNPAVPGGAFAVSFIAENSCNSVSAYPSFRQFVTAGELARAIRDPRLEEPRAQVLARPVEVLTRISGRSRGIPVTVSAVIYHEPPAAAVRLLSFSIGRVPFPVASAGFITAKQFDLIDTDFEIDRVYACGPGFVLEGRGHRYRAGAPTSPPFG